MDASLKEQIEKEDAYNKYIGYFTDEKGLMIKDPENIYKTLYKILSENLEYTKQDLGGYHFEKFILLLNDSLDEIEAEVKDYAELFYPTDHIHYGYYFYFKPKLENVLFELIGKPHPTEAVKPDEVLKNPHDKIFKNDFAFTLFDKMKGYYSDTQTPQADYSFLFDIMQKEGFVICTGTKFIDFIKDFDISITKIDSSKTGNKRKTTLYNATKENLQKKHGLSTM